MKKSVLRTALVLLTVIALITCGFSLSYSQEKKKGLALQQLEAAAGKKIEDVKVPAVPAPTPVPVPKSAKTYEVGKSTTPTTSSFDVNKSTSTASPAKTKP